MPLLPKPYPDEIIGSVICRAIRHNGLNLYAQIRAIYGVPSSEFSFLMSVRPKDFGRLAGLDAEELVLQHTMLPYSTAFMPTKLKVKYLSNALCQQVNPMSDIVRPLTRGVVFRRICPECIKKEIVQFGETYWHRSHLLPGVLKCTEHEVALERTIIPLQGTANLMHTSLPNEIPGYRLDVQVKAQLHDSVTTYSLQALNCGVNSNVNWYEVSRNRVIKAGYILQPGRVASKLLEMEVSRAFGQAYLVDMGCEVRPPDSWPAMIVRSNSDATFATPKHVLFQSFLDTIGAMADLNLLDSYRKRGPKFKDRSAEDKILAGRASLVIQEAEVEQRRLAVKELFARADYAVFSHHRAKYPLTNAIVNKLKSSELFQRRLSESK